MAKLSSHGTELYREELANCRLAYFEDGHILRDSGAGWKLYRKFKQGVNVRDAVSRKQSFRDNVTPERTMRNAFREAIVDAFPAISQRATVFMAVSILPTDPDGVWSELNDSPFSRDVEIDLELAVELCRLYVCAQEEGQAEKTAKTEALAEMA